MDRAESQIIFSILNKDSKCLKRRLLALYRISQPMIRWSLISNAACCISKKSWNGSVIR